MLCVCVQTISKGQQLVALPRSRQLSANVADASLQSLIDKVPVDLWAAKLALPVGSCSLASKALPCTLKYTICPEFSPTRLRESVVRPHVFLHVRSSMQCAPLMPLMSDVVPFINDTNRSDEPNTSSASSIVAFTFLCRRMQVNLTALKIRPNRQDVQESTRERRTNNENVLLQIIAERAKGIRSDFLPYLHSLPAGIQGLPIFFQPQDMQLLQYPPLVQQVTMRCRWMLKFASEELSQAAAAFNGVPVDVNLLGTAPCRWFCSDMSQVSWMGSSQGHATAALGLGPVIAQATDASIQNLYVDVGSERILLWGCSVR